MIEIDGSIGEGGGQMLRTSLTLSLLTGKPFRMINIRANRPRPGLAAQHLACIRAAANISSARYKGGSIGSSTIFFEPGEVQGGKYRFMIGTAGATALVLHTVALPLAYAAKMPSEITITGGTHVMAAPSYDFLRTTWLGYQKRLGLAVTLEMVRPGFYPRGGGEIRASFMPVSSIRSLHLDQAVDLATASGFAATSQLPESIVKTMVRRLKHKLNMANIESEVRTEDWENGPAAVAGITFHHAPVPTTFVALGEKGKPPEDVADEVAAEAIEYRDSGCPVDPHSADQLLLPLVFVAGHSEFRVSEVTQHLLTNRDIIRQFVSREIEIDGDKRGLGLVRIGEQASDRLAEEDATGYDSEQHQG